MENERPLSSASRPLVSVIIPAYNRAHLLGRAIDSVLAQTYPHLEIIIVDDASIDHTKELVDSYQARDNRIRYLVHERNKGPSAARNTGLAAATGNFIAFLDSDDEWLPERIERHIEVFDRHPDCHIVYSPMKWVYSDGTTRVVGTDAPEGRVFEQLLLGNVVGNPSACVIRRECFEKVGGFDEDLRYSEDYDLWLRLAKHYSFKKIPEPLVLYYRHGDQLSTKGLKSKIDATYALLAKHKEDLDRQPPTVVAHWQYTLGRLLLATGQGTEARTHLATAFRLAPWRLHHSLFLAIAVFGPRAYLWLKTLRRLGRGPA